VNDLSLTEVNLLSQNGWKTRLFGENSTLDGSQMSTSLIKNVWSKQSTLDVKCSFALDIVKHIHGPHSCKGGNNF
jgi:hypothetical protein